MLRRTTEAGHSGAQSVTPAPEQRQLRINDLILAVISWRALLDVIGGAIERAGDAVRAADVRQLGGLCEKMDTDAFLPLRSEELTSSVGRRIIQFGDLTNTLTGGLVAKGHASVKGLRKTAGNGWLGRHLRLKGYGCRLYYSSWRWASWGSSPLWLRIQGPDWKVSSVVRDALTRAGIKFRDEGDASYIPIFLVTGVERDAVVAHALAQLDRVVTALQSVGEGGSIVADPPSEISNGEGDGGMAQ